MVNSEPDANGNQDPNDRAQAQEKFNLLTGKYGTRKDLQGRSNMLATFLALSQIDTQLRKHLHAQPMPKGPKILSRTQTVDQFLENVADKLMMKLANQISGLGSTSKAKAGPVIDKLVQVLAQNESTDATMVELKTQELVNSANDRISSMITKGVSCSRPW